MEQKKVWFVTGASKGLGLTLVKALLSNGYSVAATSRNQQELNQAVGIESPRFLPLQMDLMDENSVQETVAAAQAHFGRIDVVVNNAGYAQFGTLEELTNAEVRRNFDVNVFGVLNVIRKVMPVLRAQGAGHILNISSVGGYYAGFPACGIYCSTKFAVTGLSEALAAEAKPFGIHATIVYPGYFRTSFLSEGSLNLPAQPIEAYEEARKVQQLHQDEINGNQPGDPQKAADILIQVAESNQPPLHLFLGQDAYDMVQLKDSAVHADMAAWKSQATTTSFVAEQSVA